MTELPDTLKYQDMKKFDVVVSNWNTWPDNVTRLTKEWENDFSKYIKNGGGVVSFHAGASSFYRWDDYHRIGIGRWGKDTKHGVQTKGKDILCLISNILSQKEYHDFYITDEIWEKTDIYPDAKPLASVSATDIKDGHQINENAVFVSQTGKGRSFYTILGHNERALLNSGLQTLLLRATQWVAQGDVTIEPPAEIDKRTESHVNKLNWKQTDTTLILKNDSDIDLAIQFQQPFRETIFSSSLCREVCNYLYRSA